MKAITIQKRLDKGENLWSAAAGRIGAIVGTDGHWVIIEGRSGRFVTRFDTGDAVLFKRKPDGWTYVVNRWN